MAIGRSDELTARIAATGARQAAAEVRDVADALEAVEKKGDVKARVGVDDKASGEVRRISDRLQALSREDVQVVLRARADQAEREIDKITKSLRNARQMSDEEIQVRITARDTASAELDEVRRELADLDGEEATVRVNAPGIDDLVGKLGNLPGALGQAGSALGSLAGAGGGIGLAAGAAGLLAGGLFAASQNASALAIQADEVASLTGSTVEQASGLASVWQQSGADVNDLKDVLLQMNGVLLDDEQAARDLGINLNDGKNITERFLEVVDKIQGSTLGAAEKARLMSRVFGEEGVRQVDRLVRQVGGDLSGAIDDLPDSLIQTEEDVEQARELQAAVNSIKTEFAGLAAEIGEDLVPLLAKAAGIAGSIIVDEDDVQAPDASNWEKFWYVAGGGSTRDLIGDLFSNLTGDGEQLVGTLDEAAFAAAGFGDAAGVAGAEAEAAAAQLAAAEAASEKLGERLVDTAKYLVDLGAGVSSYQQAVGSADWGAAGLQGATTAMFGYTSQFQGLRDITAGYEAAIAGMVTAVGEQAFTLDLATEAGRRNHDALGAVAEAVNVELVGAYDAANGSFDVFKEKATVIAEETLARLQAELGLSSDEVDLVRQSLGLTDGDWEARFIMSGTEEARMKIGLLQGAIDGLPEDVETRVNQLIIQGDYVGALNEIQRWYNGNPAAVALDPYPGWGSAGSAWSSLQRWYNNNPVVVGTVVRNAPLWPMASGGTAPPFRTAVAGENFRPEFVNGALVSSPTPVPPGGRVRSEWSTESLLERIARGLEDRGGGGSGQVINHIYMPAGTDPTLVMRAQKRYAERNGSG